MKVFDVIHGFQVLAVREQEELGGKLWEMTHLKTGAQLVWIDNGEDNKLFSITFTTIPEDDTGVFHILEHSVLCGSKKYPVKEPFVELLKSSMKTFLNAMTFPDKTVYPVSSRNEQDFLNLTQVYLDAVFHPAIYENPNIFYQEGWHYALDDGANIPSYQGVVFNEMKGALSSSDALLGNALMKSLYPDSCYRYVSGGHPTYIPELSYEKFLETHRMFYHPSNSKIWLDGSVPLTKTLELVNSYLSEYKISENRHEVPIQHRTPASEKVGYYEIGEDERTDFMTHMAFGKVVGSWKDRKMLTALMVLGAYLTDSNEAPLKRAILSSGLAQDVGISVADGIAQPYISVDIRNTEYEYREEIKRVVHKTLQSIVAEGLDKPHLEAVLNQMEFQFLQMEEPKGLLRNLAAMNSWLYGGDPMLYLTHRELFAELRGELKTDYYETLLQGVYLDVWNMAAVYLLPSKTKGEEERNLEHAKLVQAFSEWTAEQRDAVSKINAELEAWQCEQDTPQALESLPVLSLGEVSEFPEKIDTEEFQIGDVHLLHHKVDGHGIAHINLYFSLADFDINILPAISFLTNLLGELPTTRHSVRELQQQLKMNIGMLDFNVVTYPEKNDCSYCRPYFAVSCSALEDRIPAAMHLIAEILTQTVFMGNACTAAINEIMLQCLDGMRQAIMMEGHRFAGCRALSHFSAAAAVKELTEGLDVYSWLCDMAEEQNGRIEEFQILAQEVSKRIFASERLTISVSAKNYCKEVEEIIPLLKENKELIQKCMFVSVDGVAAKEAIQIPAGISYASAACNIQKYGYRYDGGLSVLSTILSYGYLWNEIRVQGGAYGCGIHGSEIGNVMFYSYRDPNPYHSLRIFKNTSAQIRAFCASDEPLDKYIISTIAATEPLKTLAQIGSQADTDYFCAITYEERRNTRREMLTLTKSDLLKYCELADVMAKHNAQCILGCGEALSACEEGWTVYML